MPHMPGKTCLVTMTKCFLLDQIHVGLAQTDPLEPDAVFINSSEELFEKKFTSLFILVWDTVCKWWMGFCSHDPLSSQKLFCYKFPGWL